MADTKLSALASATLGDADELYINDGGTSKKATIAELRAALNPKGFIMLDLFSVREIGVDTANEIGNIAASAAGGLLAKDTTPILERTATSTDESIRVHWILDDVDEIQFAPIPIPPDLDETVDVTVHFTCEMGGATDTTTAFTLGIWDGVGDSDAGGNTTPDITDALVEVVFTIANADIGGGPLGFFNISLFPEAHGTDAIFLYAAWIEYTRKLAV